MSRNKLEGSSLSNIDLKSAEADMGYKKEKKAVKRSPRQAWKDLGKKKRTIIYIIIAFALLLSAAAYTVFIAPLLEKEQWVYKEAAVERGSLIIGVSESGSLEYGIQTIIYDLDLDVSDDDDEDDDEDAVQKYLKIEEVYMAAGQRIIEGDPVLKFTDGSVTAVRKLLESALVDAQVAYNEAEAEYDLAVLEAQIDYDTQKVSQSYASSLYSSASSSIDNEISSMQVEINRRNANITSLEEKLADAQEDYDDALETYQDAKSVYDQTGTDNTVNYMTIQSEYLSALNKYQSAKTALEQAQDNLTDNTKQIESLTGRISAAQAKKSINKLDAEQSYQESVISGENAQITYNAQIESLKETLKESEDDKTKIEDQLAAFEEFVGTDGILYVDETGIVTEVAYEAGDTLTTAGTIVSYATPEDMTISVDVTQEDVVALAVGDSVEITFNAYPDTTYEGTILSIDTTATSAGSVTVSYTVIIGVNGDTELLYGGMTADIMFVTEEKDDVLYISQKAIVQQNEKTYVYVGNALSKELQEVKTGISNGMNVEILSGLEEGDIIYIASKVSSEAEVEDTTQTETAASDTGTEVDTNNGYGGDSFTMPEGAMPDFSGGMPGGDSGMGGMP